MNFEKAPQINNEKLESERIIQELDLRTGTQLALLKLAKSNDSAFGIGYIHPGRLKNDVRIGFPVEFNNGGTTSNVKNIKQENSKYIIQTMTSVYEILGKTPEREAKNISDFESFKTERGSDYSVLESGQVQRTKNAIDDPNYQGGDKGQKKEKEPSDIIIFYDPEKQTASWFTDFSALDAQNDKSIASLIDIGVYKKVDEKTYQLVKNNKDLSHLFIFVRVRKDDSFKLKDSFDLRELQDFQKRTLRPENKGLGIVLPSDTGDITNIPKIGFNTVDYRYGSDGKISSKHSGNSVVSIKEK